MAKALIKDNVTGEVFEVSLETAKILTNMQEFLKIIKSMHKDIMVHHNTTKLGKMNCMYTFTTEEGTFTSEAVRKGMYTLIPNTPAARVLYGQSTNK